MKPLFTIFLLVMALRCQAQVADLIFYRGKIFTSDTARLYVEAIAIKDGRILAIGSDAAIKKYEAGTTKRVNLAGKIVVPGFNDAHNHLPNPLKATKINVTELNPSWQSLVDSIKLAVKRTPKGQFITASIGLDIANGPGATRFSLDKLAPDHPVLLLSWWGHVGIFNTIALEKFGIGARQPDPKGGFYERMADGKTLTGKAFEKNAYWPNTSYNKIMAMRDDDGLIADLRGISRDLLSLGVTSFQNMCTGAKPEDFVQYWKQAGLPLRMRLIRWGDINPDGSLDVPSKQLPVEVADVSMLRVSGTKWLLEGTPLEQGAAQLDAYPGSDKWHGRMNYNVPEMEKMMQEAIARKDQICFHIGGSKTIGVILDLMSKVNVNWQALRPRFEHGDEVDYSPEYLDKLRRFGVIVVQNPTHFGPVPGMPLPLLSTHGMAMKTLLNVGIPLAIGSDGPHNPYLNIMLASTHPMRPSEALSREEAVIAYTRTSAYAEFQEQEKGSLTEGKYADLAVLSQDIFSVPLNELMKTRSLLTLVNGKVAYDAGVISFN